MPGKEEITEAIKIEISSTGIFYNKVKEILKGSRCLVLTDEN